MHRKWVVAGALGAALGTTFVAWGCGSDPEGDAGATGSGVGGGASASTTGMGTEPVGSGVGPGGLSGGGDGGLTEDSACVSQSSEATLVKRPVDIVFVIDNSGSMGDDIQGVVDNVNKNFASIIEGSGIDYRVIMVARYGAISGADVCVEQPLGGVPPGGCQSPGTTPVENPPKFFHYSENISSINAWCKLLETYAQPDDYGLAPQGWSAHLRPDSFKTFIAITDDRADCSVTANGNSHNFDATTAPSAPGEAAEFDAALLALSAEHFGTPEERNYRWHSIVGVKANSPPELAYGPEHPIVLEKCNTAVNPGFGYQSLSMMTGGLRFPLCHHAGYDAVFQAIAEGVIQGAKAACDFELPEPPPGQTLDLASVVVQYTPGGGGTPTDFAQVSGPSECAPDKFYLTGERVTLCPATCEKVQGDDAAKISVLFDCKGKVN